MSKTTDHSFLKTVPKTIDALPLADALSVHLREVHIARDRLGPAGLTLWARAISNIAHAHKNVIAIQARRAQSNPQHEEEGMSLDPKKSRAKREREDAYVADIEARLDRILAELDAKSADIVLKFASAPSDAPSVGPVGS
jgi:hypothetical protein